MSIEWWIAPGLGLAVVIAAWQSRDRTVRLPQGSGRTGFGRAGAGTPAVPGMAAPNLGEPAPTLPSAAPQPSPPPGPEDHNPFLERAFNLSLHQRQTGFFGRWWECRAWGERFAFQVSEKDISIVVGDFDPDEEQLAWVYLSQVGDAAPLPPEGSPQRLRVALGAEGEALDGRFFLNATGGDCVPLTSDAVRAALLGLSDSVREVMLFESGGVELLVDTGLTMPSLRSDLDCALALHRAMKGQGPGRRR